MINEKWSEHLEYFSNRKLQNFDNLPKLFQITPQINEKIDLEIATQRYVERLGNTQEKLLELKSNHTGIKPILCDVFTRQITSNDCLRTIKKYHKVVA
ncbi:hypothetical protein BANRA_01090 [Acinetobacter baumannii]|nr:hypothetical protein BANRA_01090 [Acinetobacter baumannii]